MFDIGFYQRVFQLKQLLQQGKRFPADRLWERLESCRSETPVVYNIETTNACNMRCEMCPRTTLMTRPVETMDMTVFARVAEQLRPHSEREWQEWEAFVQRSYGISPDDMGENHFFLYIIPKVLVLHGYGDPLLDGQMAERIAVLTEKGIPSYFSCNPANIRVERCLELFRNGLGYIKFSIESTDDQRHQEIRGKASNFSEAYRKIGQLLELKERHNCATVIVITMLNLYKPWQEEEYRKLLEAFRGCAVYIYLKSQDQQWYQNRRRPTGSLHWQEFCQFPWSSMTIKSNGEVVMCVEDYNNEIILGDARCQSLWEIWNSDAYRKFRHDHLRLTPGLKCTERCDMTLVGSFLAPG